MELMSGLMSPHLYLQLRQVFDTLEYEVAEQVDQLFHAWLKKCDEVRPLRWEKIDLSIDIDYLQDEIDEVSRQLNTVSAHQQQQLSRPCTWSSPPGSPEPAPTSLEDLKVQLSEKQDALVSVSAIITLLEMEGRDIVCSIATLVPAFKICACAVHAE
jgi:hypothetical protein